jgi:hypothetical protein
MTEQIEVNDILLNTYIRTHTPQARHMCASFLQPKQPFLKNNILIDGNASKSEVELNYNLRRLRVLYSLASFFLCDSLLLPFIYIHR